MEQDMRRTARTTFVLAGIAFSIWLVLAFNVPDYRDDIVVSIFRNLTLFYAGAGVATHMFVRRHFPKDKE